MSQAIVFVYYNFHNFDYPFVYSRLISGRNLEHENTNETVHIKIKFQVYNI